MSTVTSRLADSITASPLLAAVLVVILAAASAVIPSFAAAGDGAGTTPTVVLVHGAFAESASWDKVSGRLLARGYPVVAAANPLRTVKGDSTYVADLLDSIKGPQATALPTMAMGMVERGDSGPVTWAAAVLFAGANLVVA